MPFRSLFIITIFTLCACQKPAVNLTSTVSNQSPANVAEVNAGSINSTVQPSFTLDNVGPDSPMYVYKQAYEARKKKDVEALKQLMTKKLLDFFAQMGKEEKKSVDDMLAKLCDIPQADVPQARLKKLNDNQRATILYLDPSGDWEPMDVEKENGVWKMTLSKEDEEDMKADDEEDTRVPEPSNDKRLAGNTKRQ